MGGPDATGPTAPRRSCANSRTSLIASACWPRWAAPATSAPTRTTRFPHRYFDGTVYLNLSSDPFAFSEAEWDRIVVELQATQPRGPRGRAGLPLAPGARGRKRGVRVPSIRAVILTYGKASVQHGRRIARGVSRPRRSTSTGRPRPATSLSARRSGTIPRPSTTMRSSSWCPGGPTLRAFTRSTSRPGAARRCRSCATTRATS